MVDKSFRRCTYPACHALVKVGRCEAHKTRDDKTYNRARDPRIVALYNTREWRVGAKQFLRQHPLCMCDDCMEGQKRVRVSQVVDHRVAHRGDVKLFFSQSNWQALSKSCHDAKTSRVDGGFGNTRREGSSGLSQG